MSRRIVAKEIRPAEATIAVPALGVEDPELRPPARCPVPAPGDERLRPLSDDIPAEPDPARPMELQTEPGRFRDCPGEAGRQAGRLEDDEERLCPAGERGEAPQPFGDLRGRRAGIRARWQIDHQDVDRSGCQQHPPDRQALVKALRGQDDEPVEMDAAGNRLDRVQRAGKVQPGDDRAIGLCLGDEAEGEGRGTG